MIQESRTERMGLELAQEIEIALLQAHPRNIEIYGEEDVSELVAYIKESRWIKPLVISQHNRIISGHRRWQAARLLGYASVPFVRQIFETETDELKALLLENASRDKTPEQKVREGAEWKKIEEDEAEKRRLATLTQYRNSETSIDYLSEVENFPPRREGKARDKVAERVGFGSGRTYEKAAKVVATADQMKDDGKVEEAQALLKLLNEQSVHAATQVLNLPEPEIESVLQTIATGRTKNVKEAVKVARAEERQEKFAQTIVELDHCRVHHCSVADLHKHVEAESVDAIITDPPYPKEFLSLYTDLAQFATYALKPSGSLLVMVGQSYLPLILESITPYVPYHWTVSYLTPGGQAVQLWQKRVNTFWKPVLWFVKGSYEGEWIGDVCKSQVNDNDKRFHHWGQSISGMADILERFTAPGQLVCDPFVGGGTVAVGAFAKKRRFVGCDIDERCVQDTLCRLSEVIA